MSLTEHWDAQYRDTRPIWDVDHPTHEVGRVVTGAGIPPGRALELGSGTGANAAWLARRGFDVTGVDLSPTAVRDAEARARRWGVAARFRVGDLREPQPLGGPFDFLLDCGCYGAVRRAEPDGYLRAAARLTRPGALGLVLAGNDGEPEDALGPPVVSAADLRAEFRGLFDVERLRPFRFDPDQGGGKRYLGWSCLLRRRRAPGRTLPVQATSGTGWSARPSRS